MWALPPFACEGGSCTSCSVQYVSAWLLHAYVLGSLKAFKSWPPPSLHENSHGDCARCQEPAGGSETIQRQRTQRLGSLQVAHFLLMIRLPALLMQDFTAC